ncbi:MAG: amidohydrolase family protein, partial [Gemmataceae bacterium]|nr:amidohydrolase family protein [Gemmataceae bacterium]
AGSTGGGGTGGVTGGTGGVTGGTGGATGGTGGTGGSTGGSGGTWMLDPVVDCNVPDFDPPVDPTATCEVTATGGAGLILRGTLLLPDQVMHKGEIFIDTNGKIVCTACDCSGEPGADMATEVTCANGVISPGLINTHDHITFANNTPKAHDERYEHRHDWRKGQNGHQQITYSSGASAGAQQLQELRFLMSGATSISGSNGPNGLLRNLDQSGKLEGIIMPATHYETFPLNDGGSGFQDADISNGCSYGAGVDNASLVASQNAYEPHISEGINTAAHNEFLCTSTAPPPANANDILEPQTAIVHGVGLTAADAALIRANKAKIIWSARTNVDLYGNTAEATLLDNSGVPLATGTDWIVSGSMNMLRELRCVDELNSKYFDNHFNDKQIWQMATTNASFALGAQFVTGMLKPGYAADIAVFNGGVNKDHRAVVAAELPDVVLVLRGGKTLYGDDAIVEALRPGCGTMAWAGSADIPAFADVCGLVKRACISQDLGAGVTLSSILSATGAVYPAFFQCGQTPDLEPSCVPSHLTYPAGITGTIYTGVIDPGVDDDGDGIENAMDNCPKVFNPVRPMDEGKQADGDGDGAGDVCDTCPMDANNACTPPDANDLDDDSVPNAYDNCPVTANANQKDTDNDGHGDACDKCASVANPAYAACPATIKSIRDANDPNHPAVGSQVSVSDVYVTAVDNVGGGRGFFIQDTSLMPLTGIFVFTAGNAPNVAVGNKVNVSGTYAEYFTLSEIDSPTVTVVDPGTTLPFNPIDIADPGTIATGGAMAEGYESMLLHIGAVSISTVNPDGASDFDEFAVSPGNLRIDDQVFDVLDNACPLNTQFTELTGVLTYTFSNSKLLPRGASDIGLVDAASPNYCKPFP